MQPQTTTGTSVMIFNLSAKTEFDADLKGIANNNDTLNSNSTGSSDNNSDSSHGW